MKIAIEAQRIFRANKHGMDFVALESIRQLQRIDTENEYFILVSPGEDKCLSETDNMHIIEIPYPSYPLWEQVGLPQALKKIKPDILHCTANTAPIYDKTPLVLTLHDIIFLEKRTQTNKSLYQNLGWYYRKWVVPAILPRCEKVITVSHFECNRIKESLSLPEGKIMAIYNGVGAHFTPIANYETITRKYLPESEYLFFLGNTDPKKNTPGVLKAYSRYIEQSAQKLPLFIADLKENIIDGILEQEKITHIKPYLRLGGYIPNSDLPAIYSGAKIFIYTSYRESFGIPLLEAMACGTPVITSNTSSMPEIAADAALIADPYNIESIASGILQLETEPLLYDKFVALGKIRAGEFTWEANARQLLKVYTEVYNKNKK